MLFALAFARVASATDHFVEIQLPTQSLVDALWRHGATQGKDCPTVVEPDGLGPSIVDHVVWRRDDFLAPSLERGSGTVAVPLSVGAVQAAPLLVHLPISVRFRTLDCVYDPSCDVDDTSSVDVWLDYQLTSGPDGVCADFLGTSDLPAGTEEVVEDEIERFGRPCIDPTPALDPLLDLMFDWTDFEDVAMTADPTGEAIALRASVPDPVLGETAADWGAFLGGDLVEPWAGSERVIVDQGLLRSAVVGRLSDALTCGWEASPAACTDGVEPTGSTDSTWDAGAGEVTALVNVNGACGGPFGEIAATSRFEIAIEPPPFTDSYDQDDADYTLRMITDLGTPGWPSIGCGNAWEAVRAEWDGAFGDLGGSCSLDDDEVTCEAPLPVFRLQFSSSDGLWLAPLLPQGVTGGLSLAAIGGADSTTFPQPLGALHATRAEYGIRTEDCHAGGGYEGEITMEGGPGQLCVADDLGLPTPLAIDDPLGVFDLGVGSAIGDRVYTLHATPAYWADAYGPLVTVWSTEGARSLSLPKPVDTSPPEGQVDVELIAAILDAWVKCHPASKDPPIPGWFDVHWLIDPPPYELVVQGSGWVGAAAVLDHAQITRSEPTYDKALGLTVIKAGTATLSTTWTVSDPKSGKFAFTVDSTLPVELAGSTDALAFTDSDALRLAVPEKSLPHGVKSMAFDVPLVPGDLVFTPSVKK